MDETQDRVVRRTPTPNRKPTRIERLKLDALRRAILEVLPTQAPGVAFINDLPGLVEQPLTEEERAALGSVGWYATTVKLELNMRGEIARVLRSSPQRLIRVI